MVRPTIEDPATLQEPTKSITSIATASSGASPTTSPNGDKALARTVTERNGGQQLWIKARDKRGILSKRGFRWRKKWQNRWVELRGKELFYYTCKTNLQSPIQKPSIRGKLTLTKSARIEEKNEIEFTLYPTKLALPWLFRASNSKEKAEWVQEFKDCIDILNWWQHYELGDKLGEGGHGVVRELTDKRTGDKYAVKIIRLKNSRIRASVVSEVNILQYATQHIKHPNLVQIHKVYEEAGKVYIVLKLCTGGELYDRVVSKGRFEEQAAARLFQKVMNALHALHSHSVLHLDIKPENILFENNQPNADIVLTDFGLARIIENNKPFIDMKSARRSKWCNPLGTVGYMAPEIITAREYGPQADVFSAGVVLYIMLVARPPFNGRTELETLKNTTKGNYTMNPDDWEDISESAIDLVRRMLLVDPKERVTVEEVLNHPWILENTVDKDL